MFESERFIEDCRHALAEDSSHKAVREVVARAVADPAAVLKHLGEPERACVEKIHVSPELTIINVIWGPHLTIMPHNHKMAAIIGVNMKSDHTLATKVHSYRRADDPSSLTKAFSDVFSPTDIRLTMS